MKKISAIISVLLCGCILFSGCRFPIEEEPKEAPAVYSFSGENEQFSISNGVIVLDFSKEILYGGEFKEKQETFSDIVAYTMTFYIMSGEGKDILLSNRFEDQTGGMVNISGEIGKISGDAFIKTDAEELQNNLYFELETTNLDGKENTYQLLLNVTEVTSG